MPVASRTALPDTQQIVPGPPLSHAVQLLHRNVTAVSATQSLIYTQKFLKYTVMPYSGASVASGIPFPLSVCQTLILGPLFHCCCWVLSAHFVQLASFHRGHGRREGHSYFLPCFARCFTPQIGPELSRRSSDFLELWKLHLAFDETGELGGVLYVFKFEILDSVLTSYVSQLLCVNI